MADVPERIPPTHNMGSIGDRAWRKLNIAICGGGIGGLSAAIALRRAGHAVTIYERADFAGEVGASVSCAANGTRWLHEWEIDVQKGDPVVLKKLINRDWETGEPVSVYDLDDYEEKWGYVYNMFHRQYMHAMLMESAIGTEGKGQPAELVVNHKSQDIDTANGIIKFENGVVKQFDVVIGADGIGSACRRAIGIVPEKRPHDSSCLHTNVSADRVKELGLTNFADNSALEYWGGHNNWNKIVLSPCNGGNLLSYYCFFPREKGDYTGHTWDEDAPLEELLEPYPDLDRSVFKHLEIGKEIRPWRLWIHQEYPYWTKGVVCLIGDAGHPMLPHQSQGACMAIEDAACLGIVFSPKYFDGNVQTTLALYERIRKPRVKKVQDAAARASFNIHERIGFSSNTDNSLYAVDNESEKLTIEEMNSYDMYKDVEGKLGWIADTNGLPVAMK